MTSLEANGLVGGKLNAALANAIVAVHRRRTGRGPPKARALCHDDLLVLVLQDALTPAERTLVDAGETAAAATHRACLNDAMRGELCETVERLTGSPVVGFVCESSLAPDLTVAAFVLDRPPTPV